MTNLRCSFKLHYHRGVTYNMVAIMTNKRRHIPGHPGQTPSHTLRRLHSPSLRGSPTRHHTTFSPPHFINETLGSYGVTQTVFVTQGMTQTCKPLLTLGQLVKTRFDLIVKKKMEAYFKWLITSTLATTQVYIMFLLGAHSKTGHERTRNYKQLSQPKHLKPLALNKQWTMNVLARPPTSYHGMQHHMVARNKQLN